MFGRAAFLKGEGGVACFALIKRERRHEAMTDLNRY